MLQPKYSMHGFNWFDRRGTEGVGFIRALRTLLTNHVPRILPNLRMALANRMANAIANRQSSNGKRLRDLDDDAKVYVQAPVACTYIL